MPRIAFVSTHLTGHVYKTLSVARELVDRGESVIYIAPEQCQADIEAVGVCCEPYAFVPHPRSPQQTLNAFTGGGTPFASAWGCVTATPSILDKLKKVGPHILVYDWFAFAGQFAGELLGLPMVRLNTNYAFSNKVNYYTNTGDGRLRGTITSAEDLQCYEELMVGFFKGYGLRPRSFYELVLEPAELAIVFVSRAFHPYAEAYGPKVVFVGPVPSKAARPAGPALDMGRGDKRFLIYVSLGTLFNYQPAFFYSCLEAFADLDARVVMSVGTAFPEDYWVGVPENFVIRPFVPQLDVLANADLFVTCGGMGSVMEAVSFGVPMLLVPQYTEQMLSALRADDLGAGIFLDREEVSIRTLRQAAIRILSEPSFRMRAKELGDAGRQDGGFRRAADCIQEFAAQRTANPGGIGESPVLAQQALLDIEQFSDNQVDEMLNTLSTKRATDQ